VECTDDSVLWEYGVKWVGEGVENAKVARSRAIRQIYEMITRRFGEVVQSPRRIGAELSAQDFSDDGLEVFDKRRDRHCTKVALAVTADGNGVEFVLFFADDHHVRHF
jgi:hypothetical protein